MKVNSNMLYLGLFLAFIAGMTFVEVIQSFIDFESVENEIVFFVASSCMSMLLILFSFNKEKNVTKPPL